MIVKIKFYKRQTIILVFITLGVIFSSSRLMSFPFKLTMSDMKIFNNVVELRQSMDQLKVGDMVKTKGYYVPGDGGAAEYIISTAQVESYMFRTSNKLTEWDQNKNKPTANILVSNIIIFAIL